MTSILFGIQSAVIVLLIMTIRERNKQLREANRDLKLHRDAFIKQEQLDNERAIDWNRRYWEALKREAGQ